MYVISYTLYAHLVMYIKGEFWKACVFQKRALNNVFEKKTNFITLIEIWRYEDLLFRFA